MKDKQAFTLIELLVVVLIIGILAAVAVPQYKRAVEKSRIAQVFSALQAIKQAEEVYYLANGRYTNNMADLDVEISNIPGWNFYLMLQGNANVRAARTNAGYTLNILFNFDNASQKKGLLWCWSNDTKGKQICKTYGKKLDNTEQYLIDL